MSDNKLLAENTVRRFMKLANVDTMTDNFVTEMYGKKPKDPKELEEVDTDEEINEEEEVELEENLEDLEEQEEEEMELDTELDADMDADMGADMDADMGEEPEMGAADMSLTEEEAQLLISLGERLAAAMDEGAGDEDAPVEDAPAMDDMEDLGDAEEGEEEPPGMGGAGRYEENIDQEELVNEVLKRVTKRLVAAKLKNRK